MNAAHYDFDAMRLNVDSCINAMNGDMDALPRAFHWRSSPQGFDYWSEQMETGLQPDAKATLHYIISQAKEFELAALMRGMKA